MKRKQFLKGVSQLSEEGAIQTFSREELGPEQSIVGWWASCSLMSSATG